MKFRYMTVIGTNAVIQLNNNVSSQVDVSVDLLQKITVKSYEWQGK